VNAVSRENTRPFQSRTISSNTLDMATKTGPVAAIWNFARWATTPPQAYAAYLVALILVAGLSFYVGTLRPKKLPGMAPPPIAAPRN
jgi:hypothetical protein